MQYARTVIAYHGCDLEVAQKLLAGEPFAKSTNPYDWLGEGVYFWEWGADRAWRFAHDQKARGKVQKPAVVGALLQLGVCFDLMDTRFTQDLSQFYPQWKDAALQNGRPLPVNKGRTADLKLRYLDCAVLNAYLRFAHASGTAYDTVRCGFTEGAPVYPGSGINAESHIQLVVRNPDCIAGVFVPTHRRTT